jgi:hypothetical protein
MAKPNYRHAKRQKEAVRKARQQEKLQRKQARPDVTTQEAVVAEPTVVATTDAS